MEHIFVITTQNHLVTWKKINLSAVIFTAMIRHFLYQAKRLVECNLFNDRGYSFERNCVLRWWESETLK